MCIELKKQNPNGLNVEASILRIKKQCHNLSNFVTLFGKVIE